MTESALLRKENKESDEREKEMGKYKSSSLTKIRKIWVQNMKKLEVNRDAIVLVFSSLQPVAKRNEISVLFLKISAKLRSRAKKKVSVVLFFFFFFLQINQSSSMKNELGAKWRRGWICSTDQ